ncbi:hypothetical protein L1787_16725 [Acuticoccus sp. M5D2P5]|uniref:hypothetical protein n=1 Tax=Acuticoccus kalidii TaxID=2910977 RepID=UPI001F17E7E0|nr:hypothetical protein [Acuticoccus kalidii]MCF3935050.1 hypothetical protein [Acuticoccus kalidii]
MTSKRFRIEVGEITKAIPHEVSGDPVRKVSFLVADMRSKDHFRISMSVPAGYDPEDVVREARARFHDVMSALADETREWARDPERDPQPQEPFDDDFPF